MCTACLQVLALVLTQGQRCLSMLSVLTDVRLQGGVRGLEASVHWRHTPTLNRMSTPPHTPPHRHKHIQKCTNTSFENRAHAHTCNPPPTQTPPIIPSSSIRHHQPFIISPLGVSTYLFIAPSIHLSTDKLTQDPYDLCSRPMTALPNPQCPLLTGHDLPLSHYWLPAKAPIQSTSDTYTYRGNSGCSKMHIH